MIHQLFLLPAFTAVAIWAFCADQPAIMSVALVMAVIHGIVLLADALRRFGCKQPPKERV